MNWTPLSEMPLSVKLLISCLLVTFALEALAAGIYTGKYVGFSYDALVRTYSEREPAHRRDGKESTNKFGEVPISLDEVEDTQHKVNLQLLLQDAHVHLFSHGVMGLLTGILFVWFQIPEKWKWALIPLPFLGGTLDFAGMFLIKYVADGFAYLVLGAGSLFGISFTIAFFRAFYEMWVLPILHKET